MERIGLIGAGRAGTAVGAALAAAGHPLVGVTARSGASRERAARLLPHVPVLTADEVTTRADVVLVAVPDDLIHDVAHTLPLTSAQYVVHLSGAHGLGPLAGLAAMPVALHPSMTFPGGAVQPGRRHVHGDRAGRGTADGRAPGEGSRGSSCSGWPTSSGRGTTRVSCTARTT